jgi:signal transduction histidine kinase
MSFTPSTHPTKLLFGIFSRSDGTYLDRAKSEIQWTEMQIDGMKTPFWMSQVAQPHILLIEVDPTLSPDFNQSFIHYWRSSALPILWVIESTITQQTLTHPIYYQLTQNISRSGECILDRESVSANSLRSIAENLVARSQLTSHLNLLNMVIHDLRNPLTVIALACDFLEEMTLPPLIAPEIQQIRIAHHGLQILADTVIALAKLESHSLAVTPIDCDISLFVEQVLEDLEPIAKHRHINLDLHLPQTPIQGTIDPTLIKRVIDNLITNAIKFSPTGSTVHLSVGTIETQEPDSQTTFYIQVEDCGSGIPSTVEAQLFSPYQTGEFSYTDVPQMGLGLAFCKMAIQAHGGKLSIDPGPEGGTIFRIEL